MFSVLILSFFMVMVLLLVLSVSLLFLLLCCHPQFQFRSTKCKLSTQLDSLHQIFFSQAFHESKSFFLILVFNLKINKPDSFLMEEFLELISISLWLQPSNIQFEVIIHGLIILLLRVLRKLIFLDLLIFQLRNCRNSNDLKLRMLLILESLHLFEKNFREFES